MGFFGGYCKGCYYYCEKFEEEFGQWFFDWGVGGDWVYFDVVIDGVYFMDVIEIFGVFVQIFFFVGDWVVVFVFMGEIFLDDFGGYVCVFVGC